MSKKTGRKVICLSKNDILRLQNCASSRDDKEIQYQEDDENCVENEQVKVLAWPENKQRSKISTPESLEAQIEAEHYLARAKQMQLEQEDEVKRANKIILATKCQAIRDAQMAEKEQLMRDFRAEEERLDRMMEEDRKKGVQSLAKKKEQVKIRRGKYVQNLVEQITENDMKKLNEQETYLKESKKLQELHKQLDIQELENKKKRAEEQLKIRKELNKMNETIKYRNQLEKAEEKLANLRIQQYMQEKAAREAERDEKKRKAKIAQELEIARLRACQVRQQEVQAKAVAEAVEREQEIVARAWRAKELETAKKRMRMERDLREARAKQAEEKKRLKELEMERETKEVEMLLKKMEEDKQKQSDEKVKHEKEMLRYRKSLHEQMLEKKKRMETLRVQKQLEAREEVERQMAKKSDLKGILEMKLKDLKSHRVPEKYVIGVQKQLGL
ncbi:cilia- and flagella-associated protein 45-like [Neocloeon triangulifer]|uniref:cilia- and flagella-associated protein 45-like n=1 Tax=Neocloeon triangulifer TaxID=2078957 RepID=UPI00286F9C4D|nr:cilia- and flagella-associated protein 45-like [Neocloeon triangulifer]